ncbi:hypothetical protein J1N35_006075 [Gossypium stocksii]|uniref:Reverse transcriptase zinc-binding domain-containing protein n=1 Tax=Gossypium stocksii TaxID=47602 RepID=A0A9D4AJU7_9ROSI|nr:hypothetical protein J1N35_006075 [Gossypium stocksii]
MPLVSGIGSAELPQHILKYIACIRPPKADARNDRCTWRRTEHGRFSVADGYKQFVKNKWQPKEERWELAWKFKGAQRVRQIICLLLHDRLLTNSERCRRGISDDNSFLICGFHVETPFHAMRDCYIAKSVWNMVVPNRVAAGMAWSKVVSLYSTRRGLGIDLGREKIRWMPPPAEFYKLNTDGAVEQGTNEATAGGLIRDCRGDWSIGFFRNIGACSVLNSELWAI